MDFDVEKIRRDFPALSQTLDSGRKLVYFDNAATAQKPQCGARADILIIINNERALCEAGRFFLQTRPICLQAGRHL